jgi:hypothetical protein
LNKQYSREEYEKLLPRIIEHMQKTGEWGEFFPEEISDYPYTDTNANDYFPEQENEEKFAGEVPNGAVICLVTGKPFLITQNEKEFYALIGLPLPKIHPSQRHKDRLRMQAQKRLINRKCSICGIDIKTPFDEIEALSVLCEQCYLKTVY